MDEVNLVQRSPMKSFKVFKTSRIHGVRPLITAINMLWNWCSQREAPHYRALHKAQGIHEKLGGTGIIDDPVFKPKGMHWRTYTRQLQRLQKAESGSFPPWILRRFLSV
jgi:hypothetical protein